VGAISGNCDLGNCVMPNKPMKTMTTDMIIAKTGL